MSRFLRLRMRLRAPEPEESILVRALTLVTVLIAVTAVAVQEEFTAQGILAGSAIGAGFVVSYLRRRRRNVLLKAAVTVLILVVARDFFTALIANPYDPRVALVRLFLWLQTLHSFDLPARKDLKYSLASAVVLMAVAAVYTRDSSFGVLLLPFAFSACAATITMVASDYGRPRAAVIAQAAAALGLTAVLFGGLIFAALPRGAGLRVRWLPASPRLSLVARLHSRILNPAYPEDALSGDPRQAPPLFNPQGYIGFSTHVDLRLRGTLTRGVVMRVRTTRAAFWRGLAFDEYTGVGWRMADVAVEEYFSDQPRIAPRFSQDEPWPAGSAQVIQTFYVEAEQPNVFFAAYRPFEIYTPTGSIGVDRYAALRSPVPLEAGTIYSVISRVPDPAPRLLRRTRGSAPEAIRGRYLQLPHVADRVRDLARSLAEGRASAYDTAVAVDHYLIQNYAYSLQAPPLPAGADAVEHFLFTSRQGSCEIFASAMTVLLRAAGVPARLVTGYTTGSYNLFTGYYEVRNSDAHAWVEVYFPGAGWIEFEPTPGFPTPEDAAANPAGRWPAADGARWALELARRVAAPVGAALRGLASAGDPVNVPAGMAAVVALTLALARMRGVSRRLPGDGVAVAYAAMLGALGRRGIVRGPDVTPREFLAAIPTPALPDAAEVTAAFERARYGGRRPDGEDIARAHAAASRVSRLVRTRIGSVAR